MLHLSRSLPARTRTARAVAAAALLGLSGAASAQTTEGYSTDIEFVRPTFGYGSFVGVDVPMTRKPLAWRYGAIIQYELDPLTLYDAVDDTELGAVVTNRGAAGIGASIDLSNRVAFNLLLPLAFNWGTELEGSPNEPIASDGFGAGDVGAGGKIILLKTRRDLFNIGARGGLLLPTGRPNSYMGERSVRTNVGLLAAVNLGPLRVATDVSVLSRTRVETTEDFLLGPELLFNNGARFALPDATRTAFTAQVLSRAGLASAFQEGSTFLTGGAENSLEAIGGIQILPSEAVTVDVGAGRGLTEGYGTTDLRILSAITVQHVPKPEPPPLEVVEYVPPPPPPPEIIIEDEPPPEPIFEEDEKAIIYMDQIIIKDMIEFVVDTNILQDYSRPTLKAVADLINESAQLGHLVIEGHASQEGSFDHNYELAESRARRIWEELLKLGVASERVSYRGKGEVQPIQEGEDEESLQANRRVEFHIIQQFETAEEMPDYPESQLLPWNGKSVSVVRPPKPEPPPEPEPEEVLLDEFGLPISAEDDIEFEDQRDDEPEDDELEDEQPETP